MLLLFAANGINNKINSIIGYMSVKYYIRRSRDGHLIAIRYAGEQEARDMVNYLNEIDPQEEYYYEAH